jgi:hypothetical protein
MGLVGSARRLELVTRPRLSLGFAGAQATAKGWAKIDRQPRRHRTGIDRIFLGLRLGANDPRSGNNDQALSVERFVGRECRNVGEYKRSESH